MADRRKFALSATHHVLKEVVVNFVPAVPENYAATFSFGFLRETSTIPSSLGEDWIVLDYFRKIMYWEDFAEVWNVEISTIPIQGWPDFRASIYYKAIQYKTTLSTLSVGEIDSFSVPEWDDWNAHDYYREIIHFMSLDELSAGTVDDILLVGETPLDTYWAALEYA